MKTLKQIFIEYKSQNKAMPSFNIDSFEIFQAIEESVRETNLPCLVQLSAGEDKFVMAERLFLLAKKAKIDGLPIYLNMDHSQDIPRLEKLISLGFDMVHFDGSKFDYDKNLEIAASFIKKIHTNFPDVLIETEFNKINNAGSTSLNLTDPNQALDFINKTDADLLAVSIGNLHGVNLEVPEILDLNLLSNISKILTENKFFTLHGGSGISPDQISAALKFGIVKINVNTELRLKFKESLKQNINTSDSEKIYEYLSPVIADLKKIIIQKLTQFAHV
jgi:fructose-bisphosphate aldolase, class II